MLGLLLHNRGGFLQTCDLAPVGGQIGTSGHLRLSPPGQTVPAGAQAAQAGTGVPAMVTVGRLPPGRPASVLSSPRRSRALARERHCDLRSWKSGAAGSGRPATGSRSPPELAPSWLASTARSRRCTRPVSTRTGEASPPQVFKIELRQTIRQPAVQTGRVNRRAQASRARPPSAIPGLSGIPIPGGPKSSGTGIWASPLEAAVE